MVLIPVPKLAGRHGFVLLDLTQEFKVRAPSLQESITTTPSCMDGE